MTFGVANNADLDPSLLSREVRPFRYRIRDTIRFAGSAGSAMIAGFAVIASFMGYASLADIGLVAAFILFLISRKTRPQYALRAPIGARYYDPEGRKEKEGDGLFFIGNSFDNNEGIYVNNDDARTHMLVFGSTGSGKTRFLLSLFYQALLMGSGVMYVDGKGDTTVFGMVFSMVRRLGREDDLMVINYLTGSKTPGKESDYTRLSNTTNPFAYGPAETLRSLIVSLMRDSGGDDMWKGRASALLAAVLQTLVYLRDTGEIDLDIGKIREYLPLDKVVELTQRTDLPEVANGLLKKYLLDLPGFQLADAIQGDISPKCYEQHGFLTMQLTEVMSELSSTYKHIFDAPLGEVDYKDLVYNRRILFVMLPALEKDPDALSGLGKLVVAGVRSALAPALGEKVEGSHEEVMEAKPTNSKVPFLLIMDEYGYYSVKGFSVVAAQARSLGMSVVFAGQDFPSFKKGGEDEAKSVVANTNVKVIMKLEDQGETLQLAVERGGEADVALSTGFQMGEGLMSGYKDSLQPRTERRKRIVIRDLVSQKAGQAHVMFGDKLFRCSLYFTQPKNSPEYRLNRMLMVKRPNRDKVKSIHAAQKAVQSLLETQAAEPARLTNLDMDQSLRALINGFQIARDRKQSVDLSAKIALGYMEHQERLLDEDFVSKLRGEVAPNPEPKAERSMSPAEMDDKKQEPVIDSSEHEGHSEPNVPGSFDEELEEAISTDVPYLAVDPEADPEMKLEAEALEVSLSSMISVIIARDTGDQGRLTQKQREEALPLNQLAALERAHGATEEEAMAEAKRGMDIIDERIQYPSEPQAQKIPEDRLSRTVSEMMATISKRKISD